jgi:hypothetical protein
MTGSRNVWPFNANPSWDAHNLPNITNEKKALIQTLHDFKR